MLPSVLVVLASVLATPVLVWALAPLQALAAVLAQALLVAGCGYGWPDGAAR